MEDLGTQTYFLLFARTVDLQVPLSASGRLTDYDLDAFPLKIDLVLGTCAKDRNAFFIYFHKKSSTDTALSIVVIDLVLKAGQFSLNACAIDSCEPGKTLTNG